MWFTFRLLAHLPLPLMQGLGAWLGRLVWLISPGYRREFQRQVLASGLPMQRARGAIAHLGRMVAELPWLWARPQGRGVLDRVSFEGLAHYDAAMAMGKGVIILSPHLGCWEIGAQAVAEVRLAEHGPLAVLFRPSRKSVLAGMQIHARERDGVVPAAADASGVRLLLKTLRQGGRVAIMPDQVPPEGQGEWAPWFGRPVYTMTLLVKLAEQTGAPVLMCWIERLPWGRFKVHFAHQDELAALCDARRPLIERLTLMNQGIERLIRQAPEQYLWSYARDKQPRTGRPS
ncbi:MAG: hypothetical protein EBV20_11000 [Betaproteobacteria bacterium]|jgi:KDO2-lipid IV(A) lauroyltransferase|nr:hypothetical protein [Betaproteobacteria bacterium]NBP45039.1 hypothetical protein [Betaproteobacteria bacterium]